MHIWRFDMLLFDNKGLFNLLTRNLLKVTSTDCYVPALSISLSHFEPGPFEYLSDALCNVPAIYLRHLTSPNLRLLDSANIDAFILYASIVLHSAVGQVYDFYIYF